MKCLFLAAGYATRLYPLTENFPKPLLPVKGRAILDYLVEDLASEVDGFAVVTNHKFAGHFRAWAESYSAEGKVSAGTSGLQQDSGSTSGLQRVHVKIDVVDDGTSTNETRLGAVADMALAIEKLGLDDDILIAAGDNILDFSLKSFLDYARAKGHSCIMRYEEPDEARLHKCGVVLTGPDDLVLEMEEKPANPKSHWVCPPFYYYTRTDIRRLSECLADSRNGQLSGQPDGTISARSGDSRISDSRIGIDAPGSFAAWLASVTPVYAMPMPGKRLDIGTLDTYLAVK